MALFSGKIDHRTGLVLGASVLVLVLLALALTACQLR